MFCAFPNIFAIVLLKNTAQSDAVFWTPYQSIARIHVFQYTVLATTSTSVLVETLSVQLFKYMNSNTQFWPQRAQAWFWNPYQLFEYMCYNIQNIIDY